MGNDLKKRDSGTDEPGAARVSPSTAKAAQRYLDGAVLDPEGAAHTVRLRRHPPSPELRPFVRHFWFVSWDLRGRPARDQATLPLPAVNAVVELDGSFVYGPQTRRFVKRLEGAGAAFGALFHATGFRGWWRHPLRRLVDDRRSFQVVFGADADEVRELAARGVDDASIVSAYERFLLGLRPTTDPNAELVREWVDRVEHDPTLTRAEALADLAGVSLRALQRGFREHVGLTPKQLIRRYRLLEAAGQIVRGEALDQVRLALDLGYSDQSHFIRDFTSTIGQSPGRYAAAQRPREPLR